MTLLTVVGLGAGVGVLGVLLVVHWLTIRRELERVRIADRAARNEPEDDPYGFGSQLDVIRRGRFGGFGRPPGDPRDTGNN